LARSAPQTNFMAHTYLTFEFGNDEEKAQQARHKLESLKQAFKLDKKMLLKLDRKEQENAAAAETPKEKPAKAAESKSKDSKSAKESKKADPEPAKLASPKADINLLLRIALPNHEKLTEQRLLKRISTEVLLTSASPKTIRQADKGFAELDARFEQLE
jgi:hypothetical protein